MSQSAERRPATFDGVAAYVAARRPARFALCAYSMGGRLALDVALRIPERVERLVLVGAGGAGPMVEIQAIIRQAREANRPLNDAERAREFAAQMGLQAYALLAAAEGAVDAYAQVTGSDWKPYEGQARPAMSVDRQAAAAQMAALGM